MTDLDTVVIEAPAGATASVIWMHGLGADAHDFEPIVPHLQIPPEAGLRFVFPNAPVRPVTVNGGMQMPAWYDILSVDIDRVEDEPSVRDSQRAVEALIAQQHDSGIDAERIFLAGFSQGGAMALHVGLRHGVRLGGILSLSGYLPLAASIDDERSDANRDVPVFLAHGRHDPVVPYPLGVATRDRLNALGYPVEWRDYPMQHEVTLDEISDIGVWFRARLGV